MDSLSKPMNTRPVAPQPPPPEAAALAAAVALSNPLRRPALSLAGVDPAAIARRSHQLGTTPAVAHHLAALGHLDALSAWDHQLSHETLARNMLSLSLAQAAAAALEEAGIRCVALKGLAALIDMYGHHVGLRKMFDTDLLIDDATFTRAHRILVELGWSRVIEGPVTSRVNVEAVFIQRFGHSGATHEVKLEIHRGLTFPGRFQIHPADLWRRARRLPDAASPRWRLDPLDALLYLAVHKAQHGYYNDCRDLVDAANLLARHPDLDVDRLVRRAHRWGATAATWLFLRRAQRAFAAPVPPEALARLQPSPARADLLDRLMPDATVQLDFRQRRAFQIPLRRRLLAIAAAADRPGREASALALIAARRAADRALAALPMQLGEALAARTLDAVPLHTGQ